MLEKNLQRNCVRHAESLGCIAIKLTALGMRGAAGWPDYLFILPTGRVLFVEFKRFGGSLTKLQAYRHVQLRGHHQQVETINSIHQFKDILTTATRRRAI